MDEEGWCAKNPMVAKSGTLTDEAETELIQLYLYCEGYISYFANIQ